MRKGFALTAAAALMFLAQTANAELILKGDARVRYIVENNYLFGNLDGSAVDTWDSRVRLVFDARSKGGAYAIGRFRMADARWDGTQQTGARGEGSNLRVDMAYIGVPIGSATVEAGYMKSNVTRFLEYDQDQDQMTVAWAMYGSQWTAIYRVSDESENSRSEIDRINDNDRITYGAIVKKEFSDGYRGQANLFYVDDQRDEMTTGEFLPAESGFFWSLLLEGDHGKFSYETELAFKSSDLRQSRDESGFIINQPNIDLGDGWGWYIAGTYELDAFTTTLNIGMTLDGYEADNDFGWIMTGNSNNEPIAVIAQVGEAGDWFWVAPSLRYPVTEKLDLGGNLVWVSVDATDTDDDTTLSFKNLYEVSFDLLYKITDGVGFTWKAGLLIPELEGSFRGEDPSEDTAFGTYARLQVNF